MIKMRRLKKKRKLTKLLYDDESGCWKNGPAYIEDLYKDEFKRKVDT